MFSKLNVKKTKAKLNSFDFDFMPLFYAKPDRNITTQREGKTCSPNPVKESSHAIKGLKENTPNKHSLEPVFGTTQ